MLERAVRRVFAASVPSSGPLRLHETGPGAPPRQASAPDWPTALRIGAPSRCFFGKTSRGRAEGDRWTPAARATYRGPMSLATVHSRALDGLAAAPVTVEVHLANGLPAFTVVGLADTEVKEARERVRAALQNSGLSFPANKRITVNLAPADLPKEGGRFDLNG